MVVSKCPECGSTKSYKDEDKAERVCSKCGIVIEDSMVDTGQEWRAFDHSQKINRARTGAPLTHKRHDKGLTTEIGKGVTELFKVPAKKRGQFFRIRKWQKRLLTSKDRNMSFALSELQRLVSFLGLPKTLHEEVAKLYERALQKGLVRGRSIESIIAALVYSLSREYQTPRTLTEISQASGIGKRELGRTYRYISRKLSIRILPARADSYIPRFSSMLQLSDKTQMRAIRILKKAKETDVISGKGPCGCAAAAIYIASVLEGERKTQREVADVVGVTEVTIRNRYKEIAEALNIEEEVEKMAREDEEKRQEEKKMQDKPVRRHRKHKEKEEKPKKKRGRKKKKR
ncbi:MAG: transcription initiation factor IIB [Candidatus Aenigmarchaeota archaeon]|nr:transcription initiation factor IIB [Candidatus Aenigmarchaeota archaeon]